MQIFLKSTLTLQLILRVGKISLLLGRSEATDGTRFGWAIKGDFDLMSPQEGKAEELRMHVSLPPPPAQEQENSWPWKGSASDQ